MIPRGAPDVGWRDLLAGLWDCLFPPQEVLARAAAEAASGGQSLACLSVRSGLDLLIQALALPPGSEVLVSAVTIPDMVRVLEHHCLVPVPVDLDMQQLAVDVAALERALTVRTRAVLAGDRRSRRYLLATSNGGHGQLHVATLPAARGGRPA